MEKLPDSILIESETWVESQPQEIYGFSWRCKVCPEQQHRVYSYEAVERESAHHMRTAHGIRTEWDDIR